MSTATKASKQAIPKPPRLNPYPLWALRFWHGMRVRSYFRLLYRNRFRIHPARWGMALLLCPVTTVNSVLSRLQWLLYERRIEETEIVHPPIFIVGHWRSGTTYLHELLIRDERFSFPTTYECFAPFHFLVSEWIVPKLFWFLLPSKRPQDNVLTGFDRPQEDEFALTSMGAPTYYFRMAFPNHPAPYLETLNLENISADELNHLKRSLSWFMKALTVKKNKSLVLKSPPHTGRIGLLAELFPGAKFIHIVRDPYEVFTSMRRCWWAMDMTQGFQVPHHRELDELILDVFVRMYRGFNRQLPQIDPSHICHVRYEDLIQNPVEMVGEIYDRLDLGEFAAVRPKLAEYVATLKDFKSNQHELDPELKALIDERWGEFITPDGPQSPPAGS